MTRDDRIEQVKSIIQEELAKSDYKTSWSIKEVVFDEDDDGSENLLIASAWAWDNNHSSNAVLVTVEGMKVTEVE